ncbi:MAG TPA: TonB-dependent receptor, partial [Gemmatimonadales bacterium]|nr:TonB-dependent receptor [Gemmatimonadales bacterium]
AYYESPQALSFITSSQLREQAPAVVGDILSGLPGVDNSKDSPWEQRPVLRGLGGQRVLVLMDGSPINSARGNGPHPSLVEPEQIERVEVVRGPSSVAYGSDALGGAINIITHEPQSGLVGPSLTGTAILGGSSVDGQRHAVLELMPKIGRLTSFISSGGRTADDYSAASREVHNSAFKDYNALANLRYDFTDRTALKLGWQLYRGSDIGIPGLSFEEPGALQEFDFAFYNRDYVHLTFDHSHRSAWLAGTRAKAYWQQERRNFFSNQEVQASRFNDPQFGLGPPPAGAELAITTQDRYYDIETGGFQAQLTSVRTVKTRFTAGIDAARDITDGDNVRFRTWYDAAGNPLGATAERVSASIPDGRFDNYGTYAQAEWYAHRQWTVHGGGRYTHYRYRTDYGLSAPAAGPNPPTYFQPLSIDDDALSGSLGLSFAARSDLHLTGHIANGYRQPNATELFFNGPASVGFVVGNPYLTPERSVSYDLGMRWGPSPFAISGNLFFSNYKDLIDALPVVSGGPPGPPTFQYTNISDARIYGWEAETEWRFRRGWNARAQVSDAIGDITSAEAIQTLYQVNQDTAPLPNVPPIHGTFSLRWSDDRGRFWVEPAARWAWRTSRLPLTLAGVPQFSEFKAEWIVADLTTGARLPWGQKLLAGVRNVTDTPYRQALASVDDPGVNFFGQLTADF